MTNKKTDWAYLAGFIDGEGCLTIARVRVGKNINKLAFHRNIRVGQCSRPVLDWIVSRFGGTVYKHQKPYDRKNWYYYWALTGSKKKYEQFLLGILPYLKVKKLQAKIMLEFVRLPWGPDVESRLRLAEKIQNLNSGRRTVETDTLGKLSSLKTQSELASDGKSAPVEIPAA